jgi:hypothetical protein
MMTARHRCRTRRRRTLVASSVLGILLASGGLALTGDAAEAATKPDQPPVVVGYPAVAAQTVRPPKPLPRKAGKVPIRKKHKVRGPSTGGDAPLATASASTDRVTVRALVVAIDQDDYGVPTWKSTLDAVGARYDILYTRNAPLTADTLTLPDGTGLYNAILLTNNNMLYQDATGAYVSALTDDEWNLLWAYERDYQVRQATLYNSYGTWPEDYCLRGNGEGGVGDTPLPVSLTAAGAGFFTYLNSAAQIPVQQSFVYRDVLAADCNATSLLTAGTDVLGVLSPSTDGRERAALTFSSNQYLLQANLLVYGLFRWASKGLFFGEQRHYLNIDVDDWFNSTDELLPTGVLNSDPGFQMTAHDAYNTSTQQSALRATYPLAAQLKLGLAYNGGDADLNAGSTCSPDGGIDELTATSRCLGNDFTWINHTVTHPKMNTTDYNTNLTEISQNLSIAITLGLVADLTVLKTPEYSGLGVYHPDPENDIDPPTDFGLSASNQALLDAAHDLGVKYLHGNMSFPSHQPSCFNCGVVHPLKPSLMIVPDWPTNIAYFSTTPDEETYFYNLYYGPNGRFPYWPVDLTYDQIIDVETTAALSRVAAGTIYTNTFHIGNLRDYGSGGTLLTDWAEALIGKFSSYYSVPLLTPGWPALATYTEGRNAHFDMLSGSVEAVYDRTAGSVSVSSATAGNVTMTGARTAGFTTYGNESSAQITLAAGTPVTFTPALLP